MPDGKVIGGCRSKDCYQNDYKLLFEHLGLTGKGGPPSPVRGSKPPADPESKAKSEPPPPPHAVAG